MGSIIPSRLCGAVMALFVVVAGIVIAMPAQAGEVTVSGVAHASVDSVDDGESTDGHIASNSSRLAVSGNQDIGGGLQVIFQYESGLDLTGEGGNDGNGGAQSSGQLFTRTRDAFVGIKGDFGTLTVGRVGGLNQWVYDYNLFADQVGDLGNIFGGTGLAGRIDSTIQYITPEIGNFTGRVVYAPDEGIDGTDLTVLKGDFKASDNFKIGVAYMNQGMGSAPGVDDHTALALTGSYSFGDFSVGGGYQNESDIGGVPGADADSFTLGGTAKLGDKGVVKAQVAQFSGDAADTDATQIAVGYDYAVGDNSTLYLAYASTSNDVNTAFTANNYGHGDAVGPLPGNDPWVISFGFVYKFSATLFPGSN